MLQTEYLPLSQALELIEAATTPPRQEEAVGMRRLDFHHRAEGKLTVWIVGDGALLHRHRPDPVEEKRRLAEEARHQAWVAELRAAELRAQRGEPAEAEG